MTLPLLFVVMITILAAGYTLYGRYVAKQYSLSDNVKTPAEQFNDGIDFVPTKPFYLLGQHFSAIAAAGPIAGPILACQAFGWLPCILWIGLGVIFIGAVHDFSSLVASIKHDGRSIAEIVKKNVGVQSWYAIMIFIWIALIYVVVAFTDITAATFVGITEEFEGGNFSFNPGGAVAAASSIYLLLAVLMGIIQKKFNPPLWLMTIIFVPATLCAVWLGTKISTLLLFSQNIWGISILIYCFVASLLPVWLLLQPRGYLGGFVLYMALAIGVIGVFWGGYEIQQPVFKAWKGVNLTESLFPFLFVTIACGACSGFHGLVCSGTTSKQIARESHCRVVGYGGMLLEGFVAVIALATIMIMVQSDKMPGPGKIYGDGMGHFLTVIIGKENILFAMTFGAMAFSTFVFDTLDVSTRLSRYILQELLDWKGKTSALVATAVSVGVPMLFILNAEPGSYKLFWTLFGTSNQLLASLTLLAVTVWLKRSGKKFWFTLVPMIFVMIITLWSLFVQAQLAFISSTSSNIVLLNGVISSVLIFLAVFLLVDSLRVMLNNSIQIFSLSSQSES